eukprot:2909349-Rhodomonas_salina.1
MANSGWTFSLLAPNSPFSFWYSSRNPFAASPCTIDTAMFAPRPIQRMHLRILAQLTFAHGRGCVPRSWTRVEATQCKILSCVNCERHGDGDGDGGGRAVALGATHAGGRPKGKKEGRGGIKGEGREGGLGEPNSREGA